MKVQNLILSLAILLSSSAFGMSLESFDALSEQTRTLEAQENQIARKNELLLELNKRVAVYRKVQSTMLLGPHGLIVQSNDWAANVDQWLNAWADMLGVADIENGRVDEGSAALFGKSFDTFETSYAELLKTNAELRTKVSEINSLLLSFDDLPSSAYPAMAEQVTALNLKKKSLTDATRVLNESLVEFGSDNYEEQVKRIQTYLSKKIVIAKLNHPDRVLNLLAIQGILDFEAAYRRKFNEFRRLSQSVIKSTSELKQFEVADKLNQLTKMKNQLTAEFDASSQNAVAQEFSALLSTEFAKTTSAVKVFETRYPERNAFLRMAERERIYLSRDCKNPELSLVRDCELLRTLNRVKIDKDSIKSLSDADLKYFEAQLSKVRASPGVGADVK